MVLLLIEKEADCLTSQIKELRISVNHSQTLIRRAPTAERFSPLAGGSPQAITTQYGSYVQSSSHSFSLIAIIVHDNFKSTLEGFLPGAALGINSLIRRLTLSIYCPSQTVLTGTTLLHFFRPT
jgi:hypothetical protein